MKGIGYLILLGCLFTLCACNNITVVDSKNDNKITGESQWPQANKLFEKNVHWRGSDDAILFSLVMIEFYGCLVIL